MTAISSSEFRTALGTFLTGVTVVATRLRTADSTHAMTANAFVSLSLSPLLVAISVGDRTRMHTVLTQSRCYGITILSDEQEAQARHFAGSSSSLSPAPTFELHDGIPALHGGLARLYCQVVNTVHTGDHTLYIGHVVHLEHGDPDGHPLPFFRGAFRLPEARVVPPALLGISATDGDPAHV